MSTTFDVFPTKTGGNLTFRNVLLIAEQTLNSYLKNLSIDMTIKLFADIHDNQEAYVKEVDLDSLFYWPDNEYVWFTIENVDGGTDAHCNSISKQLFNWETYIEDTLTAIDITKELKQQIIACKYDWHFRRSAGQMPIINVAYGHLAAALAKLTDGFIFSDDGAWHDNVFPLKADQFIEVYFYPDKAKNAEDYNWALETVQSLRETFASW